MKNLKQAIQNDLVRAVKGGDKIICSTLRMVLAFLHNREIEKKNKFKKQSFDGAQDKPFDKVQGKRKTEDEVIKEGELIDEEIIEVISSEIKKSKEAISEFKKGKREDLVKKEKREIEILQKYMPEQLSDEDIKKLVKEVIEKIGAKEIKDMGKVMSELMPKVKGRADGSEVSRIVKELLIP